MLPYSSVFPCNAFIVNRVPKNLYINCINRKIDVNDFASKDSNFTILDFLAVFVHLLSMLLYFPNKFCLGF